MRDELVKYENEIVAVKAKIKFVERKRKRREFNKVLLKDVEISPLDNSETIYLDHIWVYKRNLVFAGIKVPKKNLTIGFFGLTYSYQKSTDNSFDLSVVPLPPEKIRNERFNSLKKQKR